MNMTHLEIEAEAEARRGMGALLFKHCLGLLAMKKITAKDFSILCWYADGAGVPGANWDTYMLNPESQTGKFAQKVWSNFPAAKHLMSLRVPAMRRMKAERSSQVIHVRKI